MILCASLVTILALPSCANAPAPLPTAPAAEASTSGAEAAIARVLDDWHDAAAKADEARYFGHFAPAAVFLGTDATERWDVDAFRAYAHPHFAKGKAWTFKAATRHVTLAPGGGSAWFDEALDTPHLGPARGSGVVLRDAGGRWKIAQYNLSVPIPNERFEEVKRVIAAPKN